MSDRGGGVPLRKIEQLFSYMYSTAPTPQPGTGGTPLVRWLRSSSPPAPKGSCLFLSPQTVTLPLSLPSLLGSPHSHVAVCAVTSPEAGPLLLLSLPSLPLPTYLWVCLSPFLSSPSPMSLPPKLLTICSTQHLPVHSQGSRQSWVWETDSEDPQDLSRSPGCQDLAPPLALLTPPTPTVPPQLPPLRLTFVTA